MNTQTQLTYGGTSGHSGTDTSRDRAVTRDGDGTTGKNQRIVLKALGIAGERGMTVAELRGYMRHSHHGSVSSALTNLHRAGKIARLSTKRNKCKVYVLPEYVGGRDAEPSTAVKRSRWESAVIARILDMHTPDDIGNALGLFCPECGTKWPCRTYGFVRAAK